MHSYTILCPNFIFLPFSCISIPYFQRSCCWCYVLQDKLSAHIIYYLIPDLPAVLFMDPHPNFCDLSFQVKLPPPRGCRGDKVCVSSEHQLSFWHVIRSLPAIWVFHNSCHVFNKNDKNADIKANIKATGW